MVTGQGNGRPITVLRLGATPASPLTLVGQITVNYPGNWMHPHSALGVRPTPGRAQSYDLFFQLGSQANFATTASTASISSSAIPGTSGTLLGDSIYMLTLIDDGTGVTATNLTRIAGGLRNPAGFAFHPATGDLYFQDNGIDGLSDPNEPSMSYERRTSAALRSSSLVFPLIIPPIAAGRWSAGRVFNPWWLFNHNPIP